MWNVAVDLLVVLVRHDALAVSAFDYYGSQKCLAVAVLAQNCLMVARCIATEFLSTIIRMKTTIEIVTRLAQDLAGAALGDKTSLQG
uniref:RxLR effector candidate protein n=1 Tax=Hyaloperonospora arabidopsidis (strain Emoy2) TaxID=559515 RepID=M4B7B3_HYAAE